MPRLKLREKLADGAEPAVLGIVQTLADALMRISASGDVEQVLIGFRILNHGLGFTLDRKHYGASAPLELFHELGGVAPKAGKRTDIFRDVEHGSPLSGGTFLSAYQETGLL
jgi:hypothetical protein